MYRNLGKLGFENAAYSGIWESEVLEMGGALEGGHVAQMLPDWTCKSPEEISGPIPELLIQNLEGRVRLCS